MSYVIPLSGVELVDRGLEWNGKHFKLECTYDMHLTYGTCRALHYANYLFRLDSFGVPLFFITFVYKGAYSFTVFLLIY